MGYRYDMKRMSQDGMEEQMHQIRKGKKEMPRFKLAFN
jgi:hypothetical protein